MNSFSVRCSLEFTVKAVTCTKACHFSASLHPYVNLSIHVFDQRFSTRKALPSFPLKFYEKFCLNKIFTQCYSYWDIVNALAGEHIQIALAQVNYSGVSKNLATFESNLVDFLLPESAVLLSYSDFQREIILIPVNTSNHSGIIGPRLQLSIRVLVEEVFGTFDKLLDINKKKPFGRHFMPEKLIVNRSSKQTCHYDTENCVESDQMEDRPPFVVRRADSKLISRLPSLYKEYAAKRAYCCYSPHRDGQCAACRMETKETPSKHISKKLFHAPIASTVGKGKHDTGRLIQKEKLSPEGLCLSCQQSKMKNQQSKHEVAEPIEIMRASPTNPKPNGYTQHVNWSDDTAFNAEQQKSPVFNKPTFIERFGNNDVVITEKFPKQKSYHLQTQLDQAQQTDFSYHDKALEKRAITPYTCRQLACNCYHHLYYRNDLCSCPYCPTYWRYRFDAPLPNSRSYWREFHRGLANVYDELQSFS